MKFKDDLRHAISLFPKKPSYNLKQKNYPIYTSYQFTQTTTYKASFKHNGQMGNSMNFRENYMFILIIINCPSLHSKKIGINYKRFLTFSFKSQPESTLHCPDSRCYLTSDGHFLCLFAASQPIKEINGKNIYQVNLIQSQST